jgi:hypothetical protein
LGSNEVGLSQPTISCDRRDNASERASDKQSRLDHSTNYLSSLSFEFAYVSGRSHLVKGQHLSWSARP